jgi:D-alanine--poly(phosphoribitol) ligase subunit 2
MQTMIQILAQYIKDNYDAELESRENIFSAGIIDSIGFVNLIGFVTEEFKIELEPEDLIEDNFYSLERIAQFISEKKE